MDDSRQCRATSRRSGERCKRAAIRGGTVCAMHGGRAPSVKAAAARRLALADAETLVSQTVDARGPLTLGEVYEELLRTAALTVGWRDVLEVRLTAVQEWRYKASGPGTEQLRSEVALFERALDRAAKVLELVARLDIDARASHLSQRQGAQVADALRRAMDRARLPVEQRADVERFLAEELRRVTA